MTHEFTKPELGRWMGARAVQPMIDARKPFIQVLFMSLRYFLDRYFTNLGPGKPGKPDRRK